MKKKYFNGAICVYVETLLKIMGLSKKTTCLRGRVAEINFGLMSTNVYNIGRSRKIYILKRGLISTERPHGHYFS